MVEFNLLIIVLVLDLISALPFLLGSPIEPPAHPINYILKEVDLSRKLPDLCRQHTIRVVFAWSLPFSPGYRSAAIASHTMSIPGQMYFGIV